MRELLQKVIDKSLVSKVMFSIGALVFLAFCMVNFAGVSKSGTLLLVIVVAVAFLLLTVWVKRIALFQFLYPALFISILLAGFPVGYTIYLAFTNIEESTNNTRADVEQFFLERQWHFDDNSTTYNTEVYVANTALEGKVEEFNRFNESIEAEYDSLYEGEHTDKRLEVLEERLDKKFSDGCGRIFEGVTLSDVSVVFFPESQQTDTIYLATYEGGSFLSSPITRDRLSALREGATAIGATVEFEGDVILEMEYIPVLAKLFASQTFDIEGKGYYNEFSNKFVHKIPAFRKSADNPDELIQLVKHDDGSTSGATTLKWSEQKWFFDNYLGRVVKTIDDTEPRHYRVASILNPEAHYKFYHLPFYNEHAYRFVEGEKNNLGFYDRIEEIFPAEYLQYLDETPIDDELERELKGKISLANKEVAKFRQNYPALTEKFRSNNYRRFAMLPTIGDFSYRKLDDSNIVPQGGILSPGYKVSVGLRHFRDILYNESMQNHYWWIFGWTLLWAILSVVLSFALGLVFAMVLNRPNLRGQNVYRILLLLPYAIPSALSIMLWNILLNYDFGIINNFIGMQIPWLRNPILSKVSTVTVNVWLSFPYFMIIILGALQSIDSALYEAASVDGASKRVQFTHITLPLLLDITLPLLIGYFAYSFNNFTISQLLWGHGNDIVISYIFNIANYGSRQFGLASAVSLITFVLILPITYLQIKANTIFDRKRGAK